MLQLNNDNNELKEKIYFLIEENIKMKSAVKIIMTKIK
jgi:hypothetical protein